MDAATIREARRLLHDLIFCGEATLASGTMVCPKPELLIPLIEKIASKKLEETHEPPGVTGFTPQGTYHVKEPTDAPPSKSHAADPANAQDH